MEKEKSLWQAKPDRKLIWKWTVLKGIAWSAVLVIIPFWLFMFFANLSWLLLLPLAIVFAFMLSFLWSGWLIKTYEYEITNKNVYFRGGILLKKQSIVPFFKITNLPNTQAVLDQILGITTIGVQTAGTGGVALAEITFEGITNPDEVTELLKMQIEKSRKSSVRTGSE